MSNVYLQDSTLTSIGGAIREKLNVDTKYLPSEMPEAIRSIEGGGGGEEEPPTSGYQYWKDTRNPYYMPVAADMMNGAAVGHYGEGSCVVDILCIGSNSMQSRKFFPFVTGQFNASYTPQWIDCGYVDVDGNFISIISKQYAGLTTTEMDDISDQYQQYRISQGLDKGMPQCYIRITIQTNTESFTMVVNTTNSIVSKHQYREIHICPGNVFTFTTGHTVTPYSNGSLDENYQSTEWIVLHNWTQINNNGGAQFRTQRMRGLKGIVCEEPIKLSTGNYLGMAPSMVVFDGLFTGLYTNAFIKQGGMSWFSWNLRYVNFQQNVMGAGSPVTTLGAMLDREHPVRINALRDGGFIFYGNNDTSGYIDDSDCGIHYNSIVDASGSTMVYGTSTYRYAVPIMFSFLSKKRQQEWLQSLPEVTSTKYVQRTYLLTVDEDDLIDLASKGYTIVD